MVLCHRLHYEYKNFESFFLNKKYICKILCTIWVGSCSFLLKLTCGAPVQKELISAQNYRVKMGLVSRVLHSKVTVIKTTKVAVLCRFCFILMLWHQQESHVLLCSLNSNEVTHHVPEMLKILSEARYHLCEHNILWTKQF